MGSSKLIIGLFILLIAEIVPIKGKWIFDLDLESYSNPKHARYHFPSDVYCCCDCPSSVSCCENQLSSLDDICTDRDCNNRFLICFSDASSETCVNSDTVRNDDSITFSSGSTKGGINNPIQYDGEGQGTLTVTIYLYDNLAPSDSSDFRQNYIDLIEETFQFGVTDGIGSAVTYNGVNGVISMEFGYGIRCAEGYSGNDCSTPPEDCNTIVTECPVCPVSTSVAVATSLPTPTTSQIAPIGEPDVAATASTTTSSKSSSVPIATMPPTTSTTATSPDQNNEDIIVNINNENITVNVNTSLIVSSILEALRESTSQFSSESGDGDEDNDGLLPTVVAAIVFFNLFMNVIIIIAVIIVLICLLKVKQDGLGLSARNNAYELKGSVH